MQNDLHNTLVANIYMPNISSSAKNNNNYNNINLLMFIEEIKTN